MKWSITLQTGIVTLITFIFLGYLGNTFFVNDMEQVAAAQWLVHSHEVLRAIESLSAKVKDAEIAQHDYHLIGSQLNRRLWADSLADVQKELNELAALTTDNTDEQSRIPWLDKLLFDWREEFATAASRKDTHTSSSTSSTYVSSTSAIGERVRGILSDMRRDEYRLLHERNESFRKNNSIDIRNVGVFIAITFLLLSTSFFFVFYYERQKSKINRYLQEREEIFRQLADNIQEVFWVSTADASKCLYVSPAYEQLWGLSKEELYKRPLSFLEAVIPEDRERVLAVLTRKELSTDGTGVEYRIIKSNGEERWIWSNTFPVKDENGITIRLCGISHDITERKEMEKRVSEFYSMVSHELRTPLTSIRAALGLLEGGIAGKLSDKAVQLTGVAKNESERLIRLINDILDIRKIAAGKLELKRQMVDPVSVIETTMKSLEAMAHDLHVQLISDVKSNKQFSGDKDRIIQVLTNLVSNALKFSPAGSQIKIILESDHASIKFSVVDQGPGIPTGKLDRLFRPFQQVDSSDTRAKGGTGLGLTISKAIVEEHGGKIGVNTAQGTGSTFWFELPITEQTAVPLVSEAAPKSQNYALAKRKAKILIVEDDRPTRNLIIDLLQNLDIEFFEASDGTKAIDIAIKEKPDLIILDIGLPYKDGFTVIEVLKQQNMHNTPLLVYTSRDIDKEDMQKLTLGLTKHLVKSRTSEAQFLEAVRELLNGLTKSTDKEHRDAQQELEQANK